MAWKRSGVRFPLAPPISMLKQHRSTSMFIDGHRRWARSAGFSPRRIRRRRGVFHDPSRTAAIESMGHRRTRFVFAGRVAERDRSVLDAVRHIPRPCAASRFGRSGARPIDAGLPTPSIGVVQPSREVVSPPRQDRPHRRRAVRRPRRSRYDAATRWSTSPLDAVATRPRQVVPDPNRRRLGRARRVRVEALRIAAPRRSPRLGGADRGSATTHRLDPTVRPRSRVDASFRPSRGRR